jgi:hypothetical protein
VIQVERRGAAMAAVAARHHTCYRTQPGETVVAPRPALVLESVLLMPAAGLAHGRPVIWMHDPG